MSNSKRERMIIRNTPVIDSKYKEIWQRAFAKLRVKRLLYNFSNEMQLFGTTVNIDDEDVQIEVNALLKKLKRSATEEELLAS